MGRQLNQIFAFKESLIYLNTIMLIEKAAVFSQYFSVMIEKNQFSSSLKFNIWTVLSIAHFGRWQIFL